ncbi:MAG: sigma-70 family RNA polymerase sigma factor [Bacteroidales bacterium]|nr:sigma-70 family RNA polymerase sigma factor [Bacteroidales bacterium]
MHTDEEDIIKLLRDDHSSEEGFLLLVKKYQQQLYWSIRRLVHDHDDTEDALQNTFIKVWKGIKKFRGDSQLYTWLYRIATNEALSLLKRRKRFRTLSFNDALKEMNVLSNNDPLYDGNAIDNKLQAAIISLPPKQRIVFNMKYYDDLKYEQMSEILGTSTGALKASYHLAVKKIEKHVLTD